MIMVGPGTGIAPFRGFLHDRRADGHTGRNWLFFGEQHEATDFYYRDELTAMRDDGLLTRLDVAFSRDQRQKIYVQDRMLEHGVELWRWLQDGAHFYVCGDASRMAQDVDDTLHDDRAPPRRALGGRGRGVQEEPRRPEALRPRRVLSRIADPRRRDRRRRRTPRRHGSAHRVVERGADEPEQASTHGARRSGPHPEGCGPLVDAEVRCAVRRASDAARRRRGS